MDNTEIKKHILNIPTYTFKPKYRWYKLRLANWILDDLLDDIRVWYTDLARLVGIPTEDMKDKIQQGGPKQ